jgi:hypothetical protein
MRRILAMTVLCLATPSCAGDDPATEVVVEGRIFSDHLVDRSTYPASRSTPTASSQPA